MTKTGEIEWGYDEAGIYCARLRRATGELQPVAWTPQAGGQVAAATMPVRELLLEGDRGGGKTDSAIWRYLAGVGLGMGQYWTGCIFRVESTNLQEIKRKLRKVILPIWPDAVFNGSENFWEWSTGERLYLRHLKRLEHYDGVHGWELPFLMHDELTERPDSKLYRLTFSLCRSPHPMAASLKIVVATTNPSGKGHGWVRDRFQITMDERRVGPVIESEVDIADGDNAHKSHREKWTRCYVRLRRRENRVLMESDPGYEATLYETSDSPAQLRAWLWGDWDIVAGGMFDDVWRANRNVIEPFEIPHGWTIDRSFDWGSDSPFAVCWWAVSPGGEVRFPSGRTMQTIPGDLFHFMEWYGWNGVANKGTRLINEEISRGIVEREISAGIHGRVRPGPADPMIWGEARGTGRTIANDMLQPVRIGDRSYPGVQWIRGNNERGKNGWQPVRSVMLDAYERYEPCRDCHVIVHNPELPRCSKCGKDLRYVYRERPGLFVFDTCTQFIRTVPPLPRDEKKPEDVDTDAEDHIGDALRYRVRAMPLYGVSSKTTGRD